LSPTSSDRTASHTSVRLIYSLFRVICPVIKVNSLHAILFTKSPLRPPRLE
jgi:hypothetical protein